MASLPLSPSVVSVSARGSLAEDEIAADVGLAYTFERLDKNNAGK
jgi:hypothetical protein